MRDRLASAAAARADRTELRERLERGKAYRPEKPLPSEVRLPTLLAENGWHEMAASEAWGRHYFACDECYLAPTTLERDADHLCEDGAALRDASLAEDYDRIASGLLFGEVL